jgi:hypothetical protein
MGLLDTIMGRTPIPSPGAQAGGIPQNADFGKGVLTGRQLKGAPPAPSFNPSKVTPYDAGGIPAPGPAQLMQDAPPIAPVQQMGGGMQPMPPPMSGAAGAMQGNPMMMQALQQRLAQQRGGM